MSEPAFAVIYLAPSLLLAPLLGTAAQHPRHPIRAIKAAVDRTWDMATTSRLLLFQALVLVAVWYLLVDITAGPSSPLLRHELTHPVVTNPLFPHTWSVGHESRLPLMTWLAAESSTVSFNVFPFMPVSGVSHSGMNILAGGLCSALVIFVSAVFMHSHFRRVMQRPTR